MVLRIALYSLPMSLSLPPVSIFLGILIGFSWGFFHMQRGFFLCYIFQKFPEVECECEWYLLLVSEEKKKRVKVFQSCPTLYDYTVHGILRTRILEWVAIPSLGDIPNAGIEPRSPALQVDYLPALIIWVYFILFFWDSGRNLIRFTSLN